MKSTRIRKNIVFFSVTILETLLLGHKLDVMHIEKNVCDNIIGTLFNIDGKTNDNLNARLDMESLNIRHELHPKYDDRKPILPTASYSLTNEKS